MPMKVRYETIDGEVMAETRGGVDKQYIPDSLGSTIAMMDDTQTITDTFSYWPYGEVASRTGTTPIPFQFVGTLGYYSDSQLRSYVRARYLDAGTCRWTVLDPVTELGSRDFANRYAYVGGMPITFYDVSGMNRGDKTKCNSSKGNPKGDPKPTTPCNGYWMCMTCFPPGSGPIPPHRRNCSGGRSRQTCEGDCAIPDPDPKYGGPGWTPYPIGTPIVIHDPSTGKDRFCTVCDFGALPNANLDIELNDCSTFDTGWKCVGSHPGIDWT